MRVMIVDPSELPPAYDMVAGWNMVGLKSTATDVSAEDYLEGTEYVRICGFKNGAWFLIPDRPMKTPRWSQASVTGWHSRNQEQLIHKCGSVDYGGADNHKSVNRTNRW
jgi:hypothetical protein